jgi:AraC family transcriptional activator FtrA
VISSDRWCRVAVLAYNGVDELDLVGVYAPLAKAASCRSPVFPIDAALASPTPRVTTSGGMIMDICGGLTALERADAVVVPGGPGVHALHANTEVAAALRRGAAREVVFYTVCSGIFLLARLGLANGRRVAVHTAKREQLMALDVGRVDCGYIEDGPVRSIGGATGGCAVKSVELASRILADACPGAVDYVAARMETWPSMAISVARDVVGNGSGDAGRR